jgi:hypothetical protein
MIDFILLHIPYVVHNMTSKKLLVLVGAGVMCWAIWLSQNNIVFYNIPTSSSMQVIYRGTHCIRTWLLFQKECSLLCYACLLLEILTMEIFAIYGWRFRNRLSLWSISFALSQPSCFVDGCEYYVGDGVYTIVRLCNNVQSQSSHDIETGIFFIWLMK